MGRVPAAGSPVVQGGGPCAGMPVHPPAPGCGQQAVRPQPRLRSPSRALTCPAHPVFTPAVLWGNGAGSLPRSPRLVISRAALKPGSDTPETSL